MATDNLSTYEYLVRKFGEETIKSRHKWISDTLIVWIEQHDYSQRVEVMSEQIDQILIDYFVDIDRLKEFSEIERTNTAKIYAYMAYWILRRKPLQVVTKDAAEDLVFVNENFVADFLFGYVYENPANVSIVASQRDQVGLFEDTLRYYVKYRNITPQVIEMLLLAFQAGRGYQFSVDYRK